MNCVKCQSRDNAETRPDVYIQRICVADCTDIGLHQCMDHCIPQFYVCDGHYDCFDGSDEVNCNTLIDWKLLFADNSP